MITRFLSIFTKNYWRYIFSFKKTLNAVLGTLGIIWLLVEITSYFSQNLSNFFKAHWFWLLIFGIIWIIYENWPKTEFCYKLNDRDIWVQISIGNLFDYKGHLVIPINTSYDTFLEGDLIASTSTQGQFTIKYFKESRHLDQDITTALAGEEPTSRLPHKNRGNQYRYEIGKVLKLKLENDKYAFLLAISDMNNNGVAETNFDNIQMSLASLWSFVSINGESGQINIPIIGTGRGRLIDSREKVIRAIINSFISATTETERRFCDKLNIVIYPKDFSTHQIKINELTRYLELKCDFYEYDTRRTGIGQVI
jgi:hypothetical protein